MQENNTAVKQSIEAEYNTDDATFSTDDDSLGQTAYDYYISQG